jgi:hypothetical protein
MKILIKSAWGSSDPARRRPFITPTRLPKRATGSRSAQRRYS